MADPTLKQLNALIAIADSGLFRLAAEKLNVSQPALSEQIAQLEYRLGTRLLERDRRGARLTPVGEEVVDRARRIQADVRALESVVRSGADNLGGLIRLGALPTLGPYLMPHVVPVLRQRFPELRLYVREAAGDGLEKGVRSGQFDAILSVSPVRPEGLDRPRLFDEPLLLGVPRDDALAEAVPVEFGRLEGRDILALEHGHRMADQVRALASDARARLMEDYQGTSLDGLRQMVGMGMGITLFPALYVRSEIRNDPAVIALPVNAPMASREISLMWRSGSPRQDDYRELGTVIARQARKLLDEGPERQDLSV